MTESELLASSFDWDTGSPSVFFRPMNPALSAQHFLREDSPLCLLERENWGKRCGTMLTPASPILGSSSYVSQESSCCSALNNAVIMEEDDNETIPTDEKSNPAVKASSSQFVELPRASDDVSPITQQKDKLCNVSDLAPNIHLATTILSDNNSSLQDFLIVAAVAPHHVSSPPQWSPGIRASQFESPPPHELRIEETLHFLEGMPASPCGRESSISLSIINPMMSSVQDKTTNLLPYDDSSQDEPTLQIPVLEPVLLPIFRQETVSARVQNKILPRSERGEAISTQVKQVSLLSQIKPADPVPHSRTILPRPQVGVPRVNLSSVVQSSSRSRSVTSRTVSNRSADLFQPAPYRSVQTDLVQPAPYRPAQSFQPAPYRSTQPVSRLSATSALGSVELELMAAAEGRRRVLSQIQQNRSTIERSRQKCVEGVSFRMDSVPRRDRSVDPSRTTRLVGRPRSVSVSKREERQLILPTRNRPAWRF